MFDIGPSELLLCAIVALVVIGPKDLPRVMRVVGQWVARARGMARHFRSGIDTMMREAELEEMQKQWAAENARIMAEHPQEPAPDYAGDGDPQLLPDPDAPHHAAPAGAAENDLSDRARDGGAGSTAGPGSAGRAP